jgi:hypothetical protein
MKLFGRTGGYWVFWTGFCYLVTGVTCAVYFKEVPPDLIQIIWIAAMALPFTLPALGRWLNMDINWDKNMFKWFNKSDKPNNVIPFPEPKAVPYIEPPKEPEKPAVTYYRLGITNNSRVSFQMGYSEITMNADGIDNLIKQLTVFRDQISKYEEEEQE